MIKNDEPIVVEEIFNTSINEVWKAITILDEMKKWFFPNIASFEPIEGFETRFNVKVDDKIFPHLWKLIEVIPQQKISYEWRFEGYSGIGVSTFELEKVGNQTKLALTFNTIQKFPDNIPEFKRESGVAGWTYFIKESLKEYLDKSVK